MFKIGKKNYVSDVLTVMLITFINSMIEKYRYVKGSNNSKENKLFTIGLPVIIYMFGGNFLKKYKKYINLNYLEVNYLERLIREFAESSDIKMLKDNSKYIQSDDIELIEAYEEEMKALNEMDNFDIQEDEEFTIEEDEEFTIQEDEEFTIDDDDDDDDQDEFLE